MKRPLVSVVMTTYGHEKYIEESIFGVLKQQTNFEVELIIANDRSPDNTDTIVEGIIATHPNANWIKYTCHEVNLGMMANLEWSSAQAKGKYIALCEGDDFWTDPLKLQKQVDLLQNNPKAKFCFTDVDIFMQQEKKLFKSKFKTDKTKYYVPKTIEDILVNKLYLASCTWLFEKDLLQYFDFDNGQVDATFAMAMDFISNTDFVFLPSSTAVYRSLEESASHSKSLEKKYNVHAGLLHTQLQYIQKYNLDKSLINTVTQDFYKNVFYDLIHFEQGRAAIIKKIQENENLSSDFFESVFIFASQEINNYKESGSFKLGNTILKKIYWLKNIFKVKS